MTQFGSRPATDVERAYGKLQAEILFIGRAATGHIDLVRPEAVLSGIEQARKALVLLEVAAIQMKVQRDEIQRGRDDASKTYLDQVTAHLVRNPHEISRAEALGLGKAAVAAEALLAKQMVDAA